MAAVVAAIVSEVTERYRDPINDKEAMESPEAPHWTKGTWTEYDGFLTLGTWQIIKAKDADLSGGNKPLTTKNVYKKKVHAITKDPRY